MVVGSCGCACVGVCCGRVGGWVAVELREVKEAHASGGACAAAGQAGRRQAGRQAEGRPPLGLRLTCRSPCQLMSALAGCSLCSMLLPCPVSPNSAFAVQAKGRPYNIVFVGVNGVGKSTNLAKVRAERMESTCGHAPGCQLGAPCPWHLYC